MLLKSMMQGIRYEIISGSESILVTGIQQDSRKVQKDNVFIAVKGFQSDGHEYIEKALENGANAIVGTDVDTLALYKNRDIVIVLVYDDRAAMSHMASAFFGHPSRNLSVIGLTGTNGKTSTTRIISDLLNGLGIKTALLGTISNEIAGKTYKASLTTPEPIELHTLMNVMVKDGIKACVMEASSHALDLKRVDDVQFNIAVFTNLSEDHLDYHKDFETYYQAKAKLFDLAKDGCLINVDDTYGMRLYKELKQKNSHSEKKILSYGIKSAADIQAKSIDYDIYGSSYLLKTPTGEQEVAVPLPGEIYVYNTLAAFGSLFLMGFDVKAIEEASKSIKPVPGRMEPVLSSTGKQVFVDYAHTPDAMKNALKIARSIAKGRVLVVFGCGGDRDANKRPHMGHAAQVGADIVFITSDNPRTESPLKIIEDIKAGVNMMDSHIFIQADREVAIADAIKMANANDVVLIAGKGHETYQEINHIRYDFDDRNVVKKYLVSEEVNE